MPSNEQRRQAAKRKLERQLERRAMQAKRRRTITIGATIVVVIAVVAGVFYFTRTSDDAAQPEAPPAQPQIQIPTEIAPPPQRPTPLADPVSCEYKPSGEPASKPVNPPANGEVSSKGTVQATINTNQGAIPLTLDRSLAPCTVNSFVSLAEQGFYNGTSCHRIGTTGLQMLQCGDPSGSGSGGPGYAFADETFPELQYGRGYLAMANAGPNTNGSQFFMVFGEAPLSPDYTVFGTITEEGLKVIDDVARAGDDGAYEPSPGGGKPNKQVNFEKVEIKA